ncbi:MAG: HlyC/CorC family transporter [Clostridia bacterium]|nr:HlyC/CorC family transporter [Clostridia bacterium]
MGHSLLCSVSLEVNIIICGVILLLILCSAFFSGCETAFTSVNSVRMKHYADEKVKGARRAVWIIEHFDITLSTLLVSNNLVNIASTTMCAFLLANAITNATLANILTTAIMTIVLLICGEITPKAFAKQNPEKVALRFANTFFIITKILLPITFLFNKYQQFLLKRSKKENNPTVTEEELESIIDTMQEEGVIDSTNADLIQGVLDLDQKIVYSAMTPRVDVSAIDINANPEEITKLFIDTQFSRLPVFEGDIDNIVGILSEKDYFSALVTNKSPKVKELMTPPMVVNENMKLDDMIRQMQKEKKHMAIVIDEHGGTSGIITLEDAIEEVWGEIYDEHDMETEQAQFIKIDDHNFIADAEITLEDLFEKLGIEHLPSKNYANLGAFLFELAEKSVPKQNQILEFVTIDDRMDEDAEYYEVIVKLIFKLIKVENNRIREVRITIQEVSDKI